MKSMAQLCVTCIVSLVMASAQTVTRQVPATNPSSGAAQEVQATGRLRPDSGTREDQVYTNEYFAFRYTIPEGLSAIELPTTPRKDPAKNTFVLVSARDASGRVLVMMADRASYYNGLADGSAYLQKVTRYMVGEGFQVLRESAAYEYARQKFFRADYQKAGIYQSAIFTVRSGFALGLTAAAATPEQVDELCDSLKSLAFTGPERRVKTQAFTVEAENPAMLYSEQTIGHVMVGPPPEGSKNLPSWSSGAKPGAGCEQSPDQNAPTGVRVSSGVADGLLCKDKTLCGDLAPIYPPLARAARVQGQVVLSALIGCDGKVRELHVMSGHPMLVQGAIDAVRQWTYRPYMLNGKRVELETMVTVNFTLAENPQQ